MNSYEKLDSAREIRFKKERIISILRRKEIEGAPLTTEAFEVLKAELEELEKLEQEQSQ